MDVSLQPLTDMQMQAVTVSFATRSKHGPAVPSSLQPQQLLLLCPVGGMLCQTLCLLAGRAAVPDEEFPADCCLVNKDIHGAGVLVDTCVVRWHSAVIESIAVLGCLQCIADVFAVYLRRVADAFAP